VERVFDEATTLAHVRTRAQVRELVAGMEIIEPGLTWPPQWRPDPGEEIPPNASESYYCLLRGRRPHDLTGPARAHGTAPQHLENHLS